MGLVACLVRLENRDGCSKVRLHNERGCGLVQTCSGASLRNCIIVCFALVIGAYLMFDLFCVVMLLIDVRF